MDLEEFEHLDLEEIMLVVDDRPEWSLKFWHGGNLILVLEEVW